MTYPVALLCYTPPIAKEEGEYMEAIMIAGIAVVAVSGWYSALDVLADMGIRVGRKSVSGAKNSCLPHSCRIPVQRRVKQMAGMNI